MTELRKDSQLFRDLCVLAAIATAVFFLNLGAAPLWDRDEPRNAGCAAEMLASGDWIVPVFNAELRTHKPVLLYWLMMASYALFGENEFAARFFSALLGIGSVLLTYGVGRRLFDREVGFWSALILSTTIMFGVAARAATPDSLLIFCGTLAIALFVRFAFPGGSKRSADGETDPGQFPDSWLAAVAIYAAMGFGVLAKGPVGLVLPTAVIGMYLLIIRLEPTTAPRTLVGRWTHWLRPFGPRHFARTCWAMRPMTAVATVAVIALPWYLWVGLRTEGVWVRDFFWTHNVSRATNVLEGHSGPPVLFYVAAILVGFFPWSILTIPTAMHASAVAKSEDVAVRRGLILLLSWIAVYIGIFSIFQTKLPSYITPCYPALAILAGVFVRAWRTATDFRRVWLQVGLGNLVAVGVVLLLAIPFVASRFLPGSQWLAGIGLIPIAGGLACWQLYSQARHKPATTVLAVTAMAFSVCLMGVFATEIGRHRRYEPLFEHLARHDGPVAAFGHLEPSWVFYTGCRIHEFGVTEQDRLLAFLKQYPEAVVVTTPARIEESNRLHCLENAELLCETEYFLRDRPLLLLRPRATASTVTAGRTANHGQDLPR